MKQNQRWILVVIFLLVLASWNVFGQKKEQAVQPTAWEYKAAFYDLSKLSQEQEITALGALGWELVSTTYLESSGQVLCFLKRPKK